jgi:hypothetical protein
MRSRKQFQIELRNETEALKNTLKINREQLRWIKWATTRIDRLEAKILKLGGTL